MPVPDFHWKISSGSMGCLRSPPPGGKWAGDGAGPESGEDWARVEGYMGLFERLNILHRNGVLPRPHIRHF
jgi:hypothetical protein